MLTGQPCIPDASVDAQLRTDLMGQNNPPVEADTCTSGPYDSVTAC